MVGVRGRLALGVVGLAWGLLALGCGGRSDGPPRYRVSGAITFDGKPVPAGLVVISPDLSKKNDGPQGVAEIRNGRFDTRWGKGVVGGPRRITVGGSETPDGKPLCRYEFAADLPRQDSTRDIEVPRSAAVKAGKVEEP